MSEKEIEELITKGIEASFKQFCIDRDSLWSNNLKLALSNQAALQLLIANQAKLFEKIFPDKTAEAHYQDFTAQYDINVAELSIQLIQEG